MRVLQPALRGAESSGRPVHPGFAAAVAAAPAPVAQLSRQQVRAQHLVRKCAMPVGLAELLVAWLGDRSMALLATMPPATVADAVVAGERARAAAAGAPLVAPAAAALLASLTTALAGAKRLLS